MEEDIEEKQRLVDVIERLLDAKGELEFLREVSITDLHRLVVAIRGRSEK